ncbi:hypothetical protein B0I37DRAFT_365063 [Chaetomium sp. MPI-CAGE-AT-0009]|nr:hypothetical protein B0I37DRAFT_365063 [Chaetomium sp. MPI-CAGE-AT-0009]
MAPLRNGSSDGSSDARGRQSWRQKLPAIFHRATSRRSRSSSTPAVQDLRAFNRQAREANSNYNVRNENSVCDRVVVSNKTESPDGSKGRYDENDTSESITGSTYHEAWASLDEEQKQELAGGVTARALFEELLEKDQRQQENSLMRKGLKAADPYLKKLNIALELAGPFVSLNAPAGTALGLVKGVVSIAIAVCGANGKVPENIEKLFQSIPAIDRCDEVVKTSSCLRDIRHTLVKMYKELLLFYLKSMNVFKKSRSTLRTALGMLSTDITAHVDSFNQYSSALDFLLQTETFSTTQELKGAMVDDLVRATLDADREKAHHSEFEHYSDEACAWIKSEEGFSSWLADSTDSGVLLMLGDMGCGKTITAAYVVKLLSEMGRTVCRYFCRNDHSTADLGNIYRSLLWQLLRQKPALKLSFYHWKTSSNSYIEPDRSPKQLGEFLSTVIISSSADVFIILDSLDECEVASRHSLLELFRELHRKGARIKVFLTSRYGYDPAFVLQCDITRIALRSSRFRDRAIAKFLVERSSLPSLLHETAVEELAERAEGSAIWLRIALEYIQKTHALNAIGLNAALKRLPSSAAGLAELYFNLFNESCEGLLENHTLLQTALEILAVSRRPLSLDELVCAITLDMDDVGDITTVSDLESKAPAVDVLSFLRPFVSTVELGVQGSSVVRLLHQSWPLVGKPGNQSQEQRSKRSTELNTRLLRSCIKYLLLDDCEKMKLIASLEEEDDEGGFAHLGPDLFDDDSDTDQGALVSSRGRYFDPAKLGLGRFFAYAASFWTAHFPDVVDDRRPQLADLMALCRPRSQRLLNWVYQWHRPNCTRTSEPSRVIYAIDLDPLVVTAMFGPAATLVDLLLTSHLSPPEFIVDSVWAALRELSRRDEANLITKFVKHDKIGPILCHLAFFEYVTGGFDWQTRDTRDWQELFGVSIKAQREKLLQSANKILCLAARRGCLVLVRELFDAANQDPALRLALLSTDANGTSDWNWEGALDMHQSIGQAAWEGHAEVVRFLCEQPGTLPHLHYVNHGGHTVFHQWARRHDPEVFRILHRHWPEGILLKDNNGDSPVIELMWQFNQSEERLILLLQQLHTEFGVDLSGKEDVQFMTPLLVAARVAKIKVSRFLILNCSADIYSLVGCDEATSRPFLRTNVSLPGDQKGHEEKLLKELCSFLPLATSVEYFV